MIHQFQIKMDGYNTVFSIAMGVRVIEIFDLKTFQLKLSQLIVFFQVNLPTCAQVVRRLMRYLHFLAH